MVLAEPNGAREHFLREEELNDNSTMTNLRWSTNSSKEKNDHDFSPSRGTPARLDGSPDQLFALDSGPVRTTTFERKSVKAEEAERRIRRQWYPILLLSIAMDFFLLVAIFYIIYEADYYRKSQSGFLWRACLIIFVPLVPTAILLLWPFSDWWKEKRDAFCEQKASPQWRHIVNVANAVVSFLIVLFFLFFSAIPKYNSPIWMTAVDFSGSIPVPAVAMVVFQRDGPDALPSAAFGDAANENLSGIPAEVSASNGSLDFRDYLDENGELYREQLERTTNLPVNIDAIVANSTLVQPTVDSPLQFLLSGSVLLEYQPASDPKFRSLAQTPPTMILAAFDPRLTLREVMLCSVVQTTAVNSFALNTLMMSVTQLNDPRKKMVRPQNVDPACERTYSLLETANPPIGLFDLSLTASQNINPNFSEDCRVGEVNDTMACVGGFQLMYGSQFVTTQVSVPGKSKQDIWIDVAALVGVVQFFAWFFLVIFPE